MAKETLDEWKARMEAENEAIREELNLLNEKRWSELKEWIEQTENRDKIRMELEDVKRKMHLSYIQSQIDEIDKINADTYRILKEHAGAINFLGLIRGGADAQEK